MQPINDYISTTKSYLFGAVKSVVKTPVLTTKKDSVFISTLAKEAIDKSRKEISDWRQAIQAAENPEDPRWVTYQDLIENLMTDGHLMAAIDLRKAATLSARFLIKDKNSGKEVPEKTELFKTEWFYNLINDLLDSIFRGYTVVELADPVFQSWVLWPRRNVCPQKTYLYFEAGGTKGINYSDPQFAKNVLELKYRNILGILNNIVPQLIWKRNAQQAWADFSERFGIPLVAIETNSRDKKEIDRLEAMGKQMGQGTNVILPEGSKITIHDSATKGDPYKIFDEQIRRTNFEISKCILGGTMILDDGSSRSQSEVQERQLDDKVTESDRRMIEFFINGKLIPLLRNWGLGFLDNEAFEFDRSEQISLKDHWEMVNGAATNFEIDPAWIEERFNIKILGKKAGNIQPTNTKLPKSTFVSNFQ